MTEDIKKLCKAVGMSVDMIAKKYNVHQDMVLKLFMQVMKQIQEKTEEYPLRSRPCSLMKRLRLRSQELCHLRPSLQM